MPVYRLLDHGRWCEPPADAQSGGMLQVVHGFHIQGICSGNIQGLPFALQGQNGMMARQDLGYQLEGPGFDVVQGIWLQDLQIELPGQELHQLLLGEEPFIDQELAQAFVGAALLF